ncbi:MAG TPA: putative inorganic carbon transporter subunit DabA, partial [Humisphaera sp.]
RDASEVRPEWGLARNAAFVAARRARTRGADLDGRTFLHEYDAAADPDSAVLTLILTAPVVVASWINLQYFASTVDNDAFGCGDKALHNRVGSLGVVLGNGGDLRTGLALQSVHAADGAWFHEPLRLQVVVEAAPAKIEAVLQAQPGVRELVENGWIRLFAIDPAGDGQWRRTAGRGWEPCAPVAGDLVEPAADERILEACA